MNQIQKFPQPSTNSKETIARQFSIVFFFLNVINTLYDNALIFQCLDLTHINLTHTLYNGNQDYSLTDEENNNKHDIAKKNNIQLHFSKKS